MSGPWSSTAQPPSTSGRDLPLCAAIAITIRLMLGPPDPQQQPPMRVLCVTSDIVAIAKWVDSRSAYAEFVVKSTQSERRVACERRRKCIITIVAHCFALNLSAPATASAILLAHFERADSWRPH